jgi:DNA-binding NtrC family response regulator
MSIYLRYYLDMKKKQTPDEKLPSLEEVKTNYVNYLLNVTDNDLEETAKILGVPPASLKKKIKE